MKLKIKKNRILFSFSGSDGNRKNFVGFTAAHSINTNVKQRKVQKNIVKLYNICKNLLKDVLSYFSLTNSELKDDFSLDFANSNFGQFLNITKSSKEIGFWVGFDFATNSPNNLKFGVSSTKLSNQVGINFTIGSDTFALQTSSPKGNSTDWFYSDLNINFLNNYSNFKNKIIGLIDGINKTYSLF